MSGKKMKRRTSVQSAMLATCHSYIAKRDMLILRTVISPMERWRTSDLGENVLYFAIFFLNILRFFRCFWLFFDFFLSYFYLFFIFSTFCIFSIFFGDFQFVFIFWIFFRRFSFFPILFRFFQFFWFFPYIVSIYWNISKYCKNNQKNQKIEKNIGKMKNLWLAKQTKSLLAKRARFFPYLRLNWIPSAQLAIIRDCMTDRSMMDVPPRKHQWSPPRAPDLTAERSAKMLMMFFDIVQMTAVL